MKKGAVAIVSLLTGNTIEKVVAITNTTDLIGSRANMSIDEIITEYRVNLGCCICLLVALMQFLIGFLGLGVIAAYFSDSFISGYTCGSSIHIVVSQFKDLLGLKNLKRFNGIFKVPQVNDFLILNKKINSFLKPFCLKDYY